MLARRQASAASHIGGELRYFLLLTPEQQADAIRRLARTGVSDHGIAAATRLSVEMVRRILARQM